ncbi:uncharacterized protein NEOKW01_0542 [Nematocida sp. AWRm80]|nr:uncharacterized protein NEOKW01_0542 [Nematocida sp. AWRm80]
MINELVKERSSNNYNGIISIVSKIVNDKINKDINRVENRKVEDNTEEVNKEENEIENEDDEKYGSEIVISLLFVISNLPGSRYKNTPYSEACSILGKVFELGIFKKVNKKKAYLYYKLAAENSNPFGCYRLGHFYEHGIECRRSIRKAAHFYKLSANGGCGRGAHKYGLLLLEGRRGVKRDIKGGVFYLEQAKKLATKQYPHVFYDLGLCYEGIPLVQNSIIQDLEYSLRIYSEGDKLGCIRSIVRLGLAHEYGELGLPIDLDQAASYFLKAQEKSGEARYQLYKIHKSKNNTEESIQWLKKSAELGHPTGLKEYSEYLEHTTGKTSKLEAFWWGKIADTRGIKASK